MTQRSLAKNILDRYNNELTDIQHKYLTLFAEHGEFVKVADVAGKNESTVRRGLKLLFDRYTLKSNTVPEHMSEDILSPLGVKGTSTMYDADGNRRMHWVKTQRD